MNGNSEKYEWLSLVIPWLVFIPIIGALLSLVLPLPDWFLWTLGVTSGLGVVGLLLYVVFVGAAATHSFGWLAAGFVLGALAVKLIYDVT